MNKSSTGFELKRKQSLHGSLTHSIAHSTLATTSLLLPLPTSVGFADDEFEKYTVSVLLLLVTMVIILGATAASVHVSDLIARN